MASVTPPTKTELRTDVLNLADAYGSPRWDATPGGEVDRRIGMVHAREWKRILNAAPDYNITMYTPTTDPTGAIPFSVLTSGSGDTLQILYRVRSVWFNNARYDYVESRNWLQSTIMPVYDYVWYRSGSNMMIPHVPNTTATGIFVNWYPQRFDQLAGETSVVSLPPDYDDCFSYEAAAALLTKGAAEIEAAQELRAYADTLRQDLLADIARISTDPATVQYGDSPLDWGG